MKGELEVKNDSGFHQMLRHQKYKRYIGRAVIKSKIVEEADVIGSNQNVMREYFPNTFQRKQVGSDREAKGCIAK